MAEHVGDGCGSSPGCKGDPAGQSGLGDMRAQSRLVRPFSEDGEVQPRRRLPQGGKDIVHTLVGNQSAHVAEMERRRGRAAWPREEQGLIHAVADFHRRADIAAGASDLARAR